MKSTGIVRKLDHLRRLVIPKEICDTKGFEEGTPMEIFVDGGKVILKKYQPNESCTFCNEVDNTLPFMGKHICQGCAVKLGELEAEDVIKAAERAVRA